VDRLDRLLVDAGEDWRRSQPPPAELVGFDLAARARRRPRLETFAGILGIVASGAAVALVLGLILVRPQPLNVQRGTGADLRTSLSPVRVGDHVVAEGSLVASGGRVMICRPVMDFWGGGIAGCSVVAVEIVGLDPSTLAGATSSGSTVAVRDVAVGGVWNGRAVRVEQLLDPPPPEPAKPSSPVCDGVMLGAEPSQSLDAEARYTQLQNLVDSQSELYAGEWVESSSGQTVVVVSTVGDASAAVTQIREFFPYGLCVVHVTYSGAQLAAAAAALNGARDSWQASSDARSNRTLVSLPVIDPQAASLLSIWPEAAPQPLVYRAEPTP
jgi:hypothetical protein